MKKFFYILLITLTLLIVGCNNAKEAVNLVAESVSNTAQASDEGGPSNISDGAQEMVSDATTSTPSDVQDNATDAISDTTEAATDTVSDVVDGTQEWASDRRCCKK